MKMVHAGFDPFSTQEAAACSKVTWTVIRLDGERQSTRSGDFIRRIRWEGLTEVCCPPPENNNNKKTKSIKTCFSFCLPEMTWEERTAPKMKSAGCAWRIPHRLEKIWASVSLTAKK